MAKIVCPNEQYSGISASVAFTNGIGETDDLHLIDWFKSNGYEVEEPEESKEPGKTGFEEMTVEELQAYAEEKGIDLGKSTSQEGILKKILEAKTE